MNIPKDPIILLSYVNTKLRDNYSHIDFMCDDLSLDRDEIYTALSAIGYTYNPEQNQFVN